MFKMDRQVDRNSIVLRNTSGKLDFYSRKGSNLNNGWKCFLLVNIRNELIVRQYESLCPKCQYNKIIYPAKFWRIQIKINAPIKTLSIATLQLFMAFIQCVYYLSKIHCVKSVRIRNFSGPYFPAYGLNTVK